ncbi:MAG: peptidylprolyl isomerase, partial [Methylococcales bacterium]|nr:peptidylprolyl isomerase [Methylococcales bacterium]
RKISHILFAFTKDAEEDEKQLERALKAKQELEEKEFSVLASELSDDKLTAAKGGDLGLFNVGVMEKAFEDAAGSLKLGEVSEPVKSAFGYHLIKVTELVASEIKVFDTVKDEITKAYQRSEAENTFYELGETLTEVSYENPDSLQTVADAIGLEIKKTGLFGKNVASNTADEGDIVSQAAIVNVAFSEDVLKGNNSEPVELGTDRLVVLRMLEYTPAEIKALKDVKTVIVEKLLNNKAKLATTEKAEKIKSAVVAGKSMQEVADENSLKVQKFSDLTRANGELAWQVNQAVFKAAKPVDGKSTVVTVADSTGSQTVINLLSVTEGVMSESDTARQKLAESNMAKAFGEADFNATLKSLRTNANIKINIAE